jgi:folate-binding protein YgfZ
MALCCALLDDIGQGRGIVRLQGADARRFLQGSCSGDLGALTPALAVTAALLTVKGKLVSELVVLDRGDSLELLVPDSELPGVAQQLDAHVVMDDVTVAAVPELRAAIVWDDDPDAEVDRDALATRGLLCATTRHPLPALLVVGPDAVLRDALREAEAATAEAFDRARIETATPGWGAELRPGFFPPEVGFVYAVAYDKGCYLGQEPLARIHARGQVNRVMVRVVLEHSVTTPAGLSGDAREDAGTLTTCTAEIAGAAGLAIVRREVATMGTLLRTATVPPVAVRVVSGPLGDDPGLTKR